MHWNVPPDALLDQQQLDRWFNGWYVFYIQSSSYIYNCW